MVASRKQSRVLYTIVRVPAEQDFDWLAERARLPRPSERLPWADPVIARLVSSLQDEVRGERREAKLAWRSALTPMADLDPPHPTSEDNPEWQEEPLRPFPQRR